MASRIAICIPTYQRPTYLREAIQSVLEQSYNNFTIYISDNASQDNTREVVASFHDPRIIYHRNEQNIGSTLNTKLAVQKATQDKGTEYVALLCDDDLYMPDHLAIAIDALEKHEQAAYFNCPGKTFGNGQSDVMYMFPNPTGDSPLLYYKTDRAVEFIGVTAGLGSSLVIRKVALLDHLYWGNKDFLPYDLLLYTQLMAHGGFVFGRLPTVCYRYHDANLSSYSNGKWLFNEKLVCMRAYAARYVAQFLVNKGDCSLTDIENHCRTAVAEQIVALVMGLASFESPPALRRLAHRVFRTRTDADSISHRFRIARKIGFLFFALSEKASQLLTGWKPEPIQLTTNL